MRQYPWQADFISKAKAALAHPDNQVLTLKAKRQLSKSFTMSLLAVYAIQRNAFWRVGFVTPVFKQARKVFKVLQNISLRYVGFESLVFNESRLEIVDQYSHSTIIFCSAMQGDDLRGETFNLLLIDEAAYIPDSVIDILMPTRIVNHAPLILGSTPLRKVGRFYEFFSDSSSIVCDWNLFDTSSVLTSDVLKYAKDHYAPAIYKTDYEGEFLDSGQSLLFGNLQDHISSTVPAYSKLYVGIDCGFGSEKDFTSLVALNELGQEVAVEHWNQGGIALQEASLVSWLIAHSSSIQSVYLESNSLGAPMLEHIKSALQSQGHRALASRIKADYWNAQTKAQAITDLIQGFSTNVVSVLNYDFHINELANYSMKVSSTGAITYGNATKLEADEEGLGTGGAAHDDSVCALAHAYSCFKKSKNLGVYMMS